MISSWCSNYNIVSQKISFFVPSSFASHADGVHAGAHFHSHTLSVQLLVKPVLHCLLFAAQYIVQKLWRQHFIGMLDVFRVPVHLCDEDLRQESVVRRKFRQTSAKQSCDTLLLLERGGFIVTPTEAVAVEIISCLLILLITVPYFTSFSMLVRTDLQDQDSAVRNGMRRYCVVALAILRFGSHLLQAGGVIISTLRTLLSVLTHHHIFLQTMSVPGMDIIVVDLPRYYPTTWEARIGTSWQQKMKERWQSQTSAQLYIVGEDIETSLHISYSG